MAADFSALKLSAMQLSDLDDVMEIEQQAHSHPWSKNSFIDALANYYDTLVIRGVNGELLGYFVQMIVVDEAHLLTIAVRDSMQRKGIGFFLLRQLVIQARSMAMRVVLLEVRVSNLAALRLYESFGFTAIGRRKNYYQVTSEQREDALILQYTIPEVS